MIKPPSRHLCLWFLSLSLVCVVGYSLLSYVFFAGFSAGQKRVQSEPSKVILILHNKTYVIKNHGIANLTVVDPDTGFSTVLQPPLATSTHQGMGVDKNGPYFGGCSVNNNALKPLKNTPCLSSIDGGPYIHDASCEDNVWKCSVPISTCKNSGIGGFKDRCPQPEILTTSTKIGLAPCLYGKRDEWNFCPPAPIKMWSCLNIGYDLKTGEVKTFKTFYETSTKPSMACTEIKN